MKYNLDKEINLKNIKPVYVLKTKHIEKFTKIFSDSLKNSNSYGERINKIVPHVLQCIIENPFEDSIELCKRCKLTKRELKQSYSIIQKSKISQKILEACFPKHYSFFRDRILFEDFWEKVLKGKNPFPIEVEIHPSEVCNLRCQFCPSINNDYKNQDYYQNLKNQIKNQIKNQKIFLKKVQSFFEDLAINGTKKIIFSGGKEPTLSPLILEFIGIAKKAGLLVKVTTNGSGFMIPRKYKNRTISGEDLFKFYASNLERIHLSLNACDRESFNKVKGLKKGSIVFDQIISNIRRIIFWRDKLREEKKPAVELYIAIIVDKENYRKLPQVINFMADLGADIISINRYQYQMCGQKDNFSDKEMEEVLETLQKINSKWDSKRTHLFISVEDLRNNYYKHVLQSKERCWVACCELAINPVFLGTVCDTAAFPGRETLKGVNFKLGYIFDYPNFKSYWTRTYNIRKSIHSDKCSDCRFCHKLINAYVEKVYNDYKNGFKIEHQPFYSHQNFKDK